MTPGTGKDPVKADLQSEDVITVISLMLNPRELQLVADGLSLLFEQGRRHEIFAFVIDHPVIRQALDLPEAP